MTKLLYWLRSLDRFLLFNVTIISALAGMVTQLVYLVTDLDIFFSISWSSLVVAGLATGIAFHLRLDRWQDRVFWLMLALFMCWVIPGFPIALYWVQITLSFVYLILILNDRPKPPRKPRKVKEPMKLRWTPDLFLTLHSYGR
jgi:predicted membrane protein